MSYLGSIMGSDELTASEIISGLGDVAIDALFGEIQELPTAAKRNVIKKIANSGKLNAARGTSREEFVKRMGNLDPELTKKIATGQMRLADVSYYATKFVGAKNSIDMLVDDDKKVIGVNNISMGKLEKDNVFLLDSISLLSGVGAGDITPFDVDFDMIPALVRNGQFILKANGAEIIPKSSLEMFDTEYMNCKKGEFKLANPILIQTQKEIEFRADWGTVCVAHTWLKVILKGTVAYKK